MNENNLTEFLETAIKEEKRFIGSSYHMVDSDIVDDNLLKRQSNLINNIYSAIGYIKYLENENKEEKEKCNSYLVKVLEHLCAITDALFFEIIRIQELTIEKERLVVVEENGESYIYDFTTGKRRKTKILTKNEYRDYVNHRLNKKIYWIESI